jgi:hypothetical protein
MIFGKMCQRFWKKYFNTRLLSKCCFFSIHWEVYLVLREKIFI